MITKKRAKKLSLEVWGYLKDHPEIKSKHYLPNKLISKIKNMESWCPLCQYCEEQDLPCKDFCPLCFHGSCYYYFKWDEALSNKSRQKWATKIYDSINDWEV